MKRLNKKGFTLVELLAVIIILAVVVGISIPAVMTTVDKGKTKAMETAVDAIKVYIQEQVDMSYLSSDLQGGEYNSDVATCTTGCNQSTGNILTVTGYSKNITAIQWTVDSNKKVSITCATANPNGEYNQSTNTGYTKCS